MISSINNQVKNNTSFGSIVPVSAFQIGANYAVDEKLCSSAAKNLVATLRGTGKYEDTNPIIKNANQAIRREFAQKDSDYHLGSCVKLFYSQANGVFAVLTGKDAERLRSVGGEIAEARSISDDINRSYKEAAAKNKYAEISKEVDKKLENWWDMDLTVLIRGKQKESGCVIPKSISINEKNPSGREEFFSCYA